MKLSFIILSIISFTITLLSAQSIEDEIDSLDENFKEFKYSIVIEKGKFLLGDRFTTKEDSLRIYKYILSSAYALNDTILAKQVIIDILGSEPNFALHPQDTSPKIIQFFNYVKNDLNNKKPVKSDSLVFQEKFEKSADNQFITITPGQTISSILLPGSGHLILGSNRKGYIYSSISLMLIGTNFYFYSQTNHYREKYINLKKNSPDFNTYYDKYNSAFKLRNTMLIIYGLYNLYILYDLHLSQKINLGISQKQENFQLSLTYKF